MNCSPNAKKNLERKWPHFPLSEIVIAQKNHFPINISTIKRQKRKDACHLSIILALHQLVDQLIDPNFHHFPGQNRSVFYICCLTMVVPNSKSPRQTAVPPKCIVKFLQREFFANCSASKLSPICRSVSAALFVWSSSITAKIKYDIIALFVFPLLVQKTRKVFHLLHVSRPLNCKT
jgi:hypothetical protein